MNIINALQGSAEWHAHRRTHKNASDASAMMGCSLHKTRSELLQEVSTGIEPEHDAATLRRFRDGHAYEALARPLAEAIVGEDLYPIVGSAGDLSASFDGLTMCEDVAFEHKSLNDNLRDVLHANCKGHELPLQYQVQMEQQCMVAGCRRVLFMATKWDDQQLIEARHCWYVSNPELEGKIRAGWAQFDADLATFAQTVIAAPAVAAAADSLPAVSVRMDGALAVQSNLPAFGEALRAFVANIPKKPTTDQEFADTEAACKSLKKAEDALEAAEAGALASMSDVEAMRRMVADFRALARTTRLASEKMVEARKLAIRVEIVNAAQAKLDAHQRALNDRLGAAFVPRTLGGFGEAIKGKKTVASCEDAVSVALANARIEMNALADRLEVNRKALTIDGKDWFFLFADFASIGAKPSEDFSAIALQRIQKHEADAKAEAERIAAIAAQTYASALLSAPAPAPTLQFSARPPIGPAPTDETGTIGCGHIAQRLGFALTSEFIINGLRVAPATRTARNMFWTEAQFRQICERVADHALRVSTGQDVPGASVVHSRTLVLS